MEHYDIFTENDIRRIRELPGPVLILGIGGFIGFNAFMKLRKYRDDVFGTAIKNKADDWRLDTLGDREQHDVYYGDLTDSGTLRTVLEKTRPMTIFNFTGFGGYSWDTSIDQIYSVNFMLVLWLLDYLHENEPVRLVNAGSSSEYGFNCGAPNENEELDPDSHYSVSKGAASLAIRYAVNEDLFAKHLRLYSVYGPWEDPRRLVPTAVRTALAGWALQLTEKNISRDYVYVDDVIRAFVRVSEYPIGSGVYNVATGIRTTMEKFDNVMAEVFPGRPAAEFTYKPRSWDHRDWYGNPETIKREHDWKPLVSLADGLRLYRNWLKI